MTRECIACPTSWSAKTSSNEELYIRYRGGDLTVRNTTSEDSETIYRNSIKSGFDGHMTVYELIDILLNADFSFEVTYPGSFYGFSPEECDFDIFASWISHLYCTECSWMIETEELEKVEYETVLPPKCLNCGGEYELESQVPEHIAELQETVNKTDDEEVIENLKDNFSE